MHDLWFIYAYIDVLHEDYHDVQLQTALYA